MNNIETKNFYNLYLKYKSKYLDLKKKCKIGGVRKDLYNCIENPQEKMCIDQYLLLGHGGTATEDISTPINIPDGFNIITMELVGDTLIADIDELILQKIFSSEKYSKLIKLFSSPIFGNINYMGRKFHNHPQGSSIHNIAISFRIYSNSGEFGERKTSHKVGLYKFGNPYNDFNFREFNAYKNSYNVTLNNEPKNTEEITKIINKATQGSHKELTKYLNSYTLFKRHFDSDYHIKLDKLFEILDKGTIFIYLCRDFEKSYNKLNIPNELGEKILLSEKNESLLPKMLARQESIITYNSLNEFSLKKYIEKNKRNSSRLLKILIISHIRLLYDFTIDMIDLYLTIEIYNGIYSYILRYIKEIKELWDEEYRFSLTYSLFLQFIGFIKKIINIQYLIKDKTQQKKKFLLEWGEYKKKFDSLIRIFNFDLYKTGGKIKMSTFFYGDQSGIYNIEKLINNPQWVFFDLIFELKTNLNKFKENAIENLGKYINQKYN